MKKKKRKVTYENYKENKSLKKDGSRKKKRIVYPWVKRKAGSLYKGMICVIGDTKVPWEKVLGVKTDREIFKSYFLPLLDKAHPKMKSVLKCYYKNSGREITDKEFESIAFMRFRCVFKTNHTAKTVTKTREHYLNCDMKTKYNKAKRELVKCSQ